MWIESLESRALLSAVSHVAEAQVLPERAPVHHRLAQRQPSLLTVKVTGTYSGVFGSPDYDTNPHARVGYAASPVERVYLSFSRTSFTANAGSMLPPISVRAFYTANNQLDRNFSSPLTVTLNGGLAKTAYFHSGHATISGFRLTQAMSYDLNATAQGAFGDDSLITVNALQAVSVKLTSSVYFRGTVPISEYIVLAAYDRYGNPTNHATQTVRLGKTSPAGVNVQLEATDPGGQSLGLIFKHGKPYAAHILGIVTTVGIAFPTATLAEAEATSVQLVFSDRRIKPIWTPTQTL